MALVAFVRSQRAGTLFRTDCMHPPCCGTLTVVCDIVYLEKHMSKYKQLLLSLGCIFHLNNRSSRISSLFSAYGSDPLQWMCRGRDCDSICEMHLDRIAIAVYEDAAVGHARHDPKGRLFSNEAVCDGRSLDGLGKQFSDSELQSPIGKVLLHATCQVSRNTRQQCPSSRCHSGISKPAELIAADDPAAVDTHTPEEV